MKRKQVVVVGGGVIGTAAAYYLARDDCHVTLVDRGEQGQGCSDGNCGLIALSHVLPLNVPGALRKTLGQLLRRNSAFRIGLRPDLGLWAWLVQFARNCRKDVMLRSARARQALLDSSEALWATLLEEESLACEWEDRGVLFVFKTAKGVEHYAETDRLLRETFGVTAERYDGAAVRELEPTLADNVAGGWLHRCDKHLRPERLLASWRHVLEDQGVTIRENCEARDFVRQGSAAAAVVTSGGEISADAFVVAAGAETPLLGRQLGCRIPIQPGKGYSVTMPRPDPCPQIPMIFHDDKVVVTPMETGLRLGSMMEFCGYDTSLSERRLAVLSDITSRYLRTVRMNPVEGKWYGWRPMTNDGIPIIDRSPAMENVLLAAGHNMLGLTMAPATGKLIAELVCGQPPHLDVFRYGLSQHD